MPFRSSAKSTCVLSMPAIWAWSGALYVFCLFAEILVAPANRTVPVNTTTNFFCSAKGHNLRWLINSILVHLSYDSQMYATSGIRFDETIESDDSRIHTFNATITVDPCLSCDQHH